MLNIEYSRSLRDDITVKLLVTTPRNKAFSGDHESGLRHTRSDVISDNTGCALIINLLVMNTSIEYTLHNIDGYQYGHIVNYYSRRCILSCKLIKFIFH